MVQSLANFDNALKDFYGPGLKNALNDSNPVLSQVARDKENIQGRKAVWAVQTGRSTSTGARAELATLPTADRQRFIQPSDTLAYLYHTIKVSGQAKHLTQNDRGSFARALEVEIKGAERDLKLDLARQMFNRAMTIDSRVINGAIARVNDASPSSPLAVNDLDGSTTLPSSIMRHFFVNMQVDFVTPATGAITRVAEPITAIDAANRTLSFDTLTSVADNDVIFRTGNFTTDAVDSEINGLGFLVGSQDYAGITVSSNPAWAALTAGSATTGISETLIDQAVEAVETDGNGDSPSLFVAEHAQRRKLASQMQAQKRYTNEVTLKAGWKGLELARGTLVVDRFCPSTSIFALTPSSLGWFVGLDWTWDEDDGKVLFKNATTDAIEARYKGYMNLECYERNANCIITAVEPTF